MSISRMFQRAAAAALVFSAAASAFSSGRADSVSHIKSVTAITEVYGDGQKVSAVAVEYDTAIDNAKLKPADFAVEGAVVSKVYAAASAAKAAAGVDGPFVIVEIVNTIAQETGMPAGPGAGNGNGAPPAGGGPQLGEKAKPFAGAEPLSASVTQKGAVATVSGKAYAASGSVKSTATIDLVVRDFAQAVYTDPKYPDQPLMYNLFVPKNYDPAKKYPLVLFMHDAGVVSNNPVQTLIQGTGAVAFAAPEAQAKNECFVLAPQYDRIIADDTSATTDQMDITVDLVKELLSKYSIDSGRLYNTGQSMGGMTSIAMDIKYPDLFAASLLVACQWDPAKVAPMAGKPLWIVVSEGDAKAKPGQEVILGVLKPLGDTVTQDLWNAEADSAELRKNVAAMSSAGTTVNFTVFKGGSHRYTWQYAYGIDALREWLFTQSKAPADSAQALFEKGDSLSKAGDPAGAVPYFQKAAALGSVRAAEMLGSAYSTGRGVAVDYAKAVEYLQSAIGSGSARASTDLGQLYLDGKGVAANVPKAAPETGHAEGIACAALGRLYENGLGVSKDQAKAIAWYKRGAALDDAESKAALERLGVK